MRSGFICIAGMPNAGKSTLINALVGEKVAIVSWRPQTTRNKILGVVNTDDAQIVFIDTPGIHQAKNKLGKYMMQSVASGMKDVDGVIYVLDAAKGVREEDETFLTERAESVPVIVALNKQDAVTRDTLFAVLDKLNAFRAVKAVVPVSAKKGEGLDDLRMALTEVCAEYAISSDDVIVTNARHIDALKNARTSLARVQDGLRSGLPTDLVSQDIREAIYHIGSIVGEISTDEVLGNIFKNFCIGK